MEGSIAARPQLFSLPKQPNGTGINPGFSSGVSSFAFQGTNSHLILGPAVHAAGSAEGASASAVPNWQRQYIHVLPPMHAQLSRCSAPVEARPGVIGFEMRMGHPALSFFCDHQVSSKIIFPGAGYLELVAAVGHALLFGAAAAMAAVGTTIVAPLILPHAAGSAELLGITLRAEVHCASSEVSLSTGSTTHVATSFAHLQGAKPEANLAFMPIERLAAECTVPLDTVYVYQQLAAGGLQYGPAFRLLRCVKQGKDSAAAKLRQAPQQAPAEFLMDPAVLDNCLQLGGMVPQQKGASTAGGSGPTFIPATLAALYIGSAVGSGEGAAVAQRPAAIADSEAAVLRNHMIVAARGRVACQLEGLESKSTSGRAKAGSAQAPAGAKQDMLYEVAWAAASLAQGEGPMPAHAGSQLALTAGGRVALAASGIAAAQAALGAGAVALQLQTWVQHAGHAMPGGTTEAAAAQLWGLVRTLAQECPSLAVAGSDTGSLAPTGASASAQIRLGALAQQGGFDGYGSAAFASTLYLPFMQQSTARSAAEAFQLLPMPRGSLNSLVPQPVDASGAKPGQVVVAVKAVGLNFRQVLLLPTAGLSVSRF